MDKALACEIVFRKFSWRSTDSRREPTHVEPTVPAEGAKSYCSPERGDPANVAAISSWDSSEIQWWFIQSGATNSTLCLCSLPRLITWGIGVIRGKAYKRWFPTIPGPAHPCSSKNKFNSESCILRQRGWPLPCQRSPRFPEPFVGGASTCLRGHVCSLVQHARHVCCPQWT